MNNYEAYKQLQREEKFARDIASTIVIILAVGIFWLNYWIWHDLIQVDQICAVGVGLILALALIIRWER